VWTVHLLPAERSGHRVIDGERVCQAIAAISPPQAVAAQARTFAVLGDPTRLTLLIAIKAAGPISVSDLAAATGLNDTTVSQTLRYLRAAQVVSAERDGRVIRYQLSDGPVADLLQRQRVRVGVGAPLRERAEPAAGVADIGEVDVAGDDVGDVVADDLAAQRVGDPG